MFSLRKKIIDFFFVLVYLFYLLKKQNIESCFSRLTDLRFLKDYKILNLKSFPHALL